MWFYRILLGFDALVLLVLLYFFVDGLQYSSGSGEAAQLWLMVLGVPIVAMLSGWALYGRGQRGLACAMLAVPALPAFLYLLFVVLIVILEPSWQ